MKTKYSQAVWIILLLAAISLWPVLIPLPTAGSSDESRRGAADALPIVALRAGSGKTLPFKMQNGDPGEGFSPQTSHVPQLVLYRNGTLTDARERTLVVEVGGIQASPLGVTVTVEIETQHGDPDAGGDVGQRLSLWKASKWIAPSRQASRSGGTALFVREFGEASRSGSRWIATPTDYFRYEVTVTDADHSRSDPLYALGEDYAFLMENQWVARLPEVRETSPGAAPDELIVYYADMIPFRKDADDPSTWLAREAITDYVGAELLPQMVEAFRVQSEGWGYPWTPAWTGRRAEDRERLSVALSDGETWFHGPAPSNKGLSDISMNVSSGNAAYDTLTDGLMSTFYHELFHNHQRNLSLSLGGAGWVSGKESAWAFFAEGTAALASSVGQPQVQFTTARETRDYVSYANRFLRWGSGRFQDMIAHYADFGPYYAAIYWRFLYEQCGGMQEGREDPAAGMAIIRRALTVLYSGEIVDVDSSTDTVGATPEILDRALAGSSCPFQTYQESLVTFARAVYGLRVDGGRCVEPGLPAGCGLYDPHHLYGGPPVETVTFDGAAREVKRDLLSPSGMDWIDILFAPAAEGKSLTLEFRAPPATGAEPNVQILHLADAYGSAGPQHHLVPPAATEACERRRQDGLLVCVIPEIHSAVYNRLGLIITNLDGQEAPDSMRQYTLALRPRAVP